jgi:hypothetical protein
MPRRNRRPRIAPIDLEPPARLADAGKQPVRRRVDYELVVRELVLAGRCSPTALDSSSRWLSGRLANEPGVGR